MLQGYEITPEYFRRRFRELKANEVNYIEYAHKVEKNLGKWWRAQKVNTKEEMRAAIALEQFLEVRMYLREKGVKDHKLAAILAEDYELEARPVNKETEGKRVRQENFERNALQKRPPVRYWENTGKQANGYSG